MAAKKAKKVGSVVETTIMLPAKKDVEELAEASRKSKKRGASIRGTYNEQVGKMVKEGHLDKGAFSTAMSYDGLDDEVLHIRYFQLMHLFDVLGITKRATAQEEMFAAGEMASEPSGKFKDGDGEKGGDKSSVTPFKAREPRAVEAAE